MLRDESPIIFSVTLISRLFRAAVVLCLTALFTLAVASPSSAQRPAAAQAQALAPESAPALAPALAPEWFGTWHLNIARSSFNGPSPYVRGKWRVERGQGDEVVMIYDQIGVRGGVTHMEWKGPFDGTDHRLQGPDAVVTYAYQRIDERTLALLVKIDGQATATARVTLSPDGTVTATAENQTARGPVTTVTVYEKR